MKDTEQSLTGTEKFLTVLDVALLLSVRPSTVYQWVSSGEIPHYRLGRIVRFKRKDLDVWIEEHREEKRIREAKKTREIFRVVSRGPKDIDPVIKKNIAEIKGNRYNPPQEKPGRVKGLREEVEHGAI